jgi:hypothetical protein
MYEDGNKELVGLPDAGASCRKVGGFAQSLDMAAVRRSTSSYWPNMS